MTAAAVASELLHLYPALQGLQPRELERLLAGAQLLELATGTALFGAGAPFRQYVFSLFAARLADLMGLVEAVAFHKLDRRVAAAALRQLAAGVVPGPVPTDTPASG